MMGAATEKARLPSFSLVLGIESCSEIDDLYSICWVRDKASPWANFEVDWRNPKNPLSPK